MPVTLLDHQGQGENYRLTRRLSKRGDANTLATLPNGGVFTVLLGLWESRGCGWGRGGSRELCLPMVQCMVGGQPQARVGGGFGDWEGQLSSLSEGSGSGRTGESQPCRHLREAFSQEIRLPPVLSFQRDNVPAFLRPGGGLARWPTTLGVRPVLTRLGASRTKLENAVKASVFPTKLHFPSASIQHPTHKLTPGICCLLLFLLLCLLRRLFFKELLMTHSNQV